MFAAHIRMMMRVRVRVDSVELRAAGALHELLSYPEAGAPHCQLGPSSIQLTMHKHKSTRNNH